MSQEEVFLYAVHPRRVITGISGVNAIRTAKSLYLSKEDVLKCLEKASVYRRFDGNVAKNERVTTANVERLHRKEYISEEDWPAFIAAGKAEGAGQTVVPAKQEEVIPEEPKQEEKPEEVETPQVNDESIQETVEDNATAQIAEDDTDVITNEETNETVTDEEETVVDENVVEENAESKEDEAVDTSKREQININQQQYHGKKHRK